MATHTITPAEWTAANDLATDAEMAMWAVIRAKYPDGPEAVDTGALIDVSNQIREVVMEMAAIFSTTPTFEAGQIVRNPVNDEVGTLMAWEPANDAWPARGRVLWHDSQREVYVGETDISAVP